MGHDIVLEDDMVIDAHIHYRAEKGYLGWLLRECDRLGIDKVCLLGRVDDLVQAKAESPDRVIPLALVRLGYDAPTVVDDLRDRGMTGLKIINPRYNYDDERNFPIYRRADAYGMPILFHLGIVARGEQDVALDKNSNRMRPIYLDYIARTFPSLKIIGAHLGNPWYEEASMSARWNSNLWFDLSGSTLKKKTPEFIRSLFWWDKPGHPYRAHGGKHPFEKIVFGTDVAIEWMEDVYNDYRNLVDAMEVPEEYRRRIFGETAAEIFGIEV